MRMLSFEDIEHVLEFARALRICYGCAESIANPFDYGNASSVGFDLKRNGKHENELNPQRDFGYFLGEQHGKFFVGIKNEESEVSACECFDTEAEMKMEWIIDY